MPRTFVPITEDELREKIRNSALPDMDEYDDPGLRGQVGRLVDHEQIRKDLKIKFDFENFECEKGEGYNGTGPLTGIVKTDNCLTFVGCCAGGDWEVPVFFIIYWDGSKLRAYVPTRGNTFNRTTKQAYGNDGEADYKDAKKVYEELHEEIDNAYEPAGVRTLSSGGTYTAQHDDFDTSVIPECDPALLLKDIVERIQPKEAKGPIIAKFPMKTADNIKITKTTDGSMFCIQPTLNGALSGEGIMLPRDMAAKLASTIVEML